MFWQPRRSVARNNIAAVSSNLPSDGLEAGGEQGWEGTQLEQLTQADQRGAPYQMTSCPAWNITKKKEWSGHFLVRHLSLRYLSSGATRPSFLRSDCGNRKWVSFFFASQHCFFFSLLSCLCLKYFFLHRPAEEGEWWSRLVDTWNPTKIDPLPDLKIVTQFSKRRRGWFC